MADGYPNRHSHMCSCYAVVWDGRQYVYKHDVGCRCHCHYGE